MLYFGCVISHGRTFTTQLERQVAMVTPHHYLQWEDIGGVVVITFRNQRLVISDEQVIKDIGEELFFLADANQGRNLLVNFSNVEHLSSRMFGKLISLNEKIVGCGGTLIFCGFNQQIFEVFKIIQFERHLKITQTQEEALKQF